MGIHNAMSTISIKEEQWIKQYAFLKAFPSIYVNNEESCLKFIQAILWIVRSGAQWRLLPESYGNWNSVYKRFARWDDKGVWEAMFDHFADDPDMESVMLDATIVRAHPCAAGAPKKEGGQENQDLGRSKGGFSSKVHVAVDGLGNPLRFRLTGGERHEMTKAEELIEGLDMENAIADKAYDSDDFIKGLKEKGIEVVIPPRSNRKEKRSYDKELYKERHLVECFINKIKHFRRVFSRFDKLARRYLAFLHFASTFILAR